MESNHKMGETTNDILSGSTSSVISTTRVPPLIKPVVPPKPDKVAQMRPKSEQNFALENGSISRRQSAADVLEPAVKNNTKTLQSPRPPKSPAPPIPVQVKVDSNTDKPESLPNCNGVIIPAPVAFQSLDIFQNALDPSKQDLVKESYESLHQLGLDNSKSSLAIIDVSSSHTVPKRSKSIDSVIDMAPVESPLRRRDDDSVFSLNFQPKSQQESETKAQYYWRRFCEVLFRIATFCIKCIGPV